MSRKGLDVSFANRTLVQIPDFSVLKKVIQRMPEGQDPSRKVMAQI